MSENSNNNGRGYEYIFLLTLEREISKIRNTCIEKNSSYFAAQKAWNNLDENFKHLLELSSSAALKSILELEPLLTENKNDLLTLCIQPDTKGISGDVRDIIIIRSAINWEIGLSLKHNHFAVKHCRLSKGLDFCREWFGTNCTQNYWNEIAHIFQYLEKEKAKKTKWCEIESKETDIYIPLLNAFMQEIKRQNSKDNLLPQKMVSYLLGKYDFYKIISLDSKKITQIQSFNFNGTLNRNCQAHKPQIVIPRSYYPTKIISLDFKEQSNTTVELYMNNGWQFSFRIHNASTVVETSLKFDIQIIGMPTTIISINCVW